MAAKQGPYEKIYSVIRRVPRGKVVTYGQVAALAGLPKRARLVGTALREAPDGLDLPWQRVINAGGKVSSRGDLGVREGYQRHLLEEEGVIFDAHGRTDLERFGWDPDAAPRRRGGTRLKGSCLSPSSPGEGGGEGAGEEGRGDEGLGRGRRSEGKAIEAILRPLGTKERAEGSKSYLKSDLDFIGVTTPDLRAAARAWLKAHPELDRPALVALAADLWATNSHELRSFGMELLQARVALLRSEDIDLLEDLLRRSRSWAYVDFIATQIVGPLVERDARLNARLDRWVKDPDYWLRRSAVLALLVPLRRGGGDWPRFVRYADRLLEEKEFFIRKALGWVLREVSKKDPERVRRFLAEREGRVSGVTRREAEKYL
ncbi:MAG TPA: DNA alkylation repair protein [Thermoanaerobaculia bacterium]|jgi:alkylated DNA nucleotide flippase Atl1/3-methyladenine DNA glycosylase AlkD|nr:DNA alkylation repair protein [Thermoanaerobaculia bacterium]